MALVAGQIETLLRDELDRVGDDADARFAAHRHAFERFSRRLPLDSRLVQLYKQLDILIRDMETAQKKAARQRNQYQTQGGFEYNEKKFCIIRVSNPRSSGPCQLLVALFETSPG